MVVGRYRDADVQMVEALSGGADWYSPAGLVPQVIVISVLCTSYFVVHRVQSARPRAAGDRDQCKGTKYKA